MRTLVPVFKERVWGGGRIAGLFPGAPRDRALGEAWLLSDHPAGRTPFSDGGNLRDLAPGQPWFPVLIKLLHAETDLSVQVHPNDEQAAAAGDRGKTEGWLILHAEPGARICYGLETVDPARFRALAAAGRVSECLRYVPVQAGEYYPVPAGTVHALGGGVVALEVQQASDTTYRLYDYGRPRELHIEQALAVTSFPQPAPPAGRPTAGEAVVLDDNPYFHFSVVWVDGQCDVPARPGRVTCAVSLDPGVAPAGAKAPDGGRAFQAWAAKSGEPARFAGSGRLAVVRVPV